MLFPLFVIHDFLSDFLTRHFFFVKRVVLVVAHLSLLGFFFPAMRQDFGSVAIGVLLFLLFLSPVSRIFRMKLLLQLMGLRREMGIFMAYLASVHGLGYLLDPDWFAFLITPYWPGDLFAMDTRYLFGFGAYFLTLPLLLTSNNLSMRLLGGKNWKRLHTLVYPLLFLALFHKFLRPNAVRIEDIFFSFFIFSLYVAVKALARKNFLPFVPWATDRVATRYREFTAQRKEGKSSP